LALWPAVTQNLQENGAIKLYGDLLQTSQKPAGTPASAGSVEEQAAEPQAVSPDQLGQYVAEQAAGGLFKKVATRELAIRDSLNNIVASPQE
jgi:hypothetical protein